MKKLKEAYRQNIYAIITTLAFHVVLLIVLLISDLRIHESGIEEPILIDFAQTEMKLPEPEKDQEMKEQRALEQKLMNSGGSSSNQGVNDAAKRDGSSTQSATTNDPFFDKNYKSEVAAAKALAGDVNKTLSQKIPQIGDIPMPVDNQEGKTMEQVRQSNYKGKSNIHYFLENRFHVRLPIPVYLSQGGGEVTVDILVDRAGNVISATPRINGKVDDLLYAYAKQAAEKTIFNEDSSAPEKQRGTITYRFVAQ